MKAHLVVGLLALLGAAPASAATVQWILTGTVTFVDAAFSSVNVGDTYTLTIAIDPATPDQFTSGGNGPIVGSYDLTGFSVALGTSYSASYAGAATRRIGFGNFSSADSIELLPSAGDLAPLDGLAMLGGGFYIRLQDAQGTALTSDALVLLTDLSPFETRTFTLLFGASKQIRGTLTSAVVVPEPSLALLFPAAIATGLIARRRRRS